jgi:cytochrome c553
MGLMTNVRVRRVCFGVAVALVSSCTETAGSSLVTDGGAKVKREIVPRPEAVLKGEALAFARNCSGCHSSPVGLHAGSPVMIGQGAFGSNISPDIETGIGSWSDQEIIRALRFGIDREGSTLCSEMPREPLLSNEDAAYLVAYLRSIPPTNNSAPQSQCSPAMKDQVMHGKIITDTLCTGCHGQDLSGRERTGPNITPDLETGLGRWSRDAFIAAVKDGIDIDGQPLCSTMPRFDNLTEDEAKALSAYVESVRPVARALSMPVCLDTMTPEMSPTAGDSGLPRPGADDAGTPGGEGIDAGRPSPDAGSMTVMRPDVAINEIGTSTGRFFELINRGTTSVDLSGHHVAGLDVTTQGPDFSTAYTLPAGTVLVPGGLLLFINTTAAGPSNACGDAAVLSCFWVAFTSDVTVVLTPTNEELTRGEAPLVALGDGRSWGRIPNGTGPFMETLRTPGQSNRLATVQTCTGNAPVVISQIYGAGGNSGAVFKSDYVEVHNRSSQSISIGGWGLQYAAAAGTNWGVATIPSGTVLGPGAFLTLSLAKGNSGLSLPGTSLSLVPALNLSTTSGKVALTSNAIALGGSCPSGPTVVDLVGYGLANCAEGTMAAPVLSNTTAATRRETAGAAASCIDTDVNSSDFVTTNPEPHQSSAQCGCP